VTPAAKLSRFFLPTLREAPSDADNVSAKLMFRSGMIRKVASGIYEWLPLGLRVLRKIERIIREEMDSIGGQEVSLPVVQPRALWDETSRWGVYGKELLRFKDRKDGEFCFAPTAEEVVTDLVRREIRSWRQLPLMLYQIGLKFRDEIRPRFGVMRSREFLMKDAYSFHAGEDDVTRYYGEVVGAYKKIFGRCGLNFRPVEAQSGAIGGSFSHEFMVLAETGEETIVSCADPQCGYAANIERAEASRPGDARTGPSSANDPNLKTPADIPTPGLHAVEEVAKLLGEQPRRFLKTQLYILHGKPVMALLRGDHQLNEAKLAAHLAAPEIRRANEDEYVKFLGCPVGFAGPQGHPDVPIHADYAALGVLNGITGANKNGFHARNINMWRDFNAAGQADLRMTTAGDPCPRCGRNLEWHKGIEVGHTFKLGIKYSQAMGATYLDKNQNPQPAVMGCYGIGVGRTVAAAIEQNHDAAGIRWPASIAPFHAVLIVLDLAADPRVREAAASLRSALLAAGVELLEDDREDSPGVKFKDADLIGIPLRIVLSKKSLDRGGAEIKLRSALQPEIVPLSECLPRSLALLGFSGKEAVAATTE
jgi:prolyl-tRNA synthetase